MENSVEDTTLGSDKATVTSGMSHRHGIGLMRLCGSLKGLAEGALSIQYISPTPAPSAPSFSRLFFLR